MSKANKRAAAGATAHRLNLRAVAILAVVAASIALGLVGLSVYRGRAATGVYLAEARRAFDGGKMDVALPYVNNYLRESPRDVDALELKGRILDRSPSVEEAIRVQTQILALDPSRMEARKRLIELNLRGFHYRAAQAAAEDYLKRGADDAEAHRLMARALEGVGLLGDPKALDGDPAHPEAPYAVAEYEKAERLKPGDVDGGFRLALLYRSQGKAPKAVGLMRSMLAANPKSVAAHLAAFRFFATLGRTEVGDNADLKRAMADLAKASGLGRAGDPAAMTAAEMAAALAEGELRRALEIAPGDAGANMLAADVAVQAGDTAEARRRLAAIDPPPKDDLQYKLIKGMIEFREQRPDEGVQSWRSGLIQTGGSNVDLTWRLARVLIGLGRFDEARPLMAQYRRLSGAEPTFEYRYLSALEALRMGRVKEALAGLEAIRDQDKGSRLLPSSQYLITLGDAYAAARDETRAMDAYRRAASAAGAGAQPWLAMARLQVADRPAEAIKSLEGGLAAVPNDPMLLAMLAQVLFQREAAKPRDSRDWSEFLGQLGRAEKLTPNAPELALLRADYLALSDRLPEALKRIEEATGRAPALAGPWLARVTALTQLRRFDEALATLDAATKAAGENAQFRVARANLLLRRDEPKAAYAALAEGIDRVPADQRPQLWRALGDFHRRRDDLDNARRAFEEWAKLQPDSTEPRAALLDLAIAKVDGPAMEAQAEAIKKVAGPDAMLSKVARAQVLLKLKPLSPDGLSGGDKARLDEVERLAAEIKAAAPREAAGHLIEAQLMERRRRTDAAIAAYKAALDRRGGGAGLRPLVNLLAREGRDAELEEVRKKVASFPAELDQFVSAVKLQMGNPAEAEQLADRMVQGDPQGLDANVWKAKVLNTLGKPREAEATLRLLTDQRPDDPNPWFQLLMFQVSRGELEQARATLVEMKKKLRPERPELLWAACYRVLNMRPEADESFAAALSRWPDDPGVRQAAVEYYEATGRLDLAEASLRHLLAVRPGFDWARRRLALNLSSRPDDPKALSEAMGLVGEAPGGSESPDDRQLRAVVLSRSTDPRNRAEAIRILEALAVESPDRAKLHEVLARALAASADQAEASGERAASAGNRAKAEENAARAAEDRAKARTHADRAAEPADAGADVVLFDAILRLRDKDIAGAEAQLARLEKVDAKALPTVELRARILHAKGDDAGAERLIADTFDAHKTAADATAVGIGLLRLLTALGRPDAAERLGGALAGLDARGRIAFAEFLAGRGKVKEARAQLDAAAKAGAVAEAARTSIALAGEMPGAAGEWVEQADGLLGLALKGQPGSPELLQAQAYLRHLGRDYDSEIKIYKDIIAKNPNNYYFLNNMAWTLSEEMGKPAEGLARIDEAIAKVGRQSHLIDTRGVILYRLGRLEEAIKDLEAAAAALPSGPIDFHLARAYKAAGKTADFEKYRALAREAGLKAEQLQPSERDEAEKLIGFPASRPTSSPPTP